MELICITYTNHSPNHLCNELGGSLAIYTHLFHTSIWNVEEFPYPRQVGYIIPLNMAVKKDHITRCVAMFLNTLRAYSMFTSFFFHIQWFPCGHFNLYLVPLKGAMDKPFGSIDLIGQVLKSWIRQNPIGLLHFTP
jgi:hypothetical protein